MKITSFERIKKKILTTVCTIAVIATALPVSVSAHALPDEKFSPVDGTMLYVSEGSQDSDVYVQSYWRIPFNILEGLVADGCKIYITSYNEETSYLTTSADVPAGSVPVGVFRGHSIDVLSEKVIRSDGDTLIHEVGHFLDNNSNGGYAKTGVYYYASSTAEWESIYRAEKKAVMSLSRDSSHNCYTACEFFASSFVEYIRRPDALKKAAPRTYAYMDACVKAYCVSD